MPRNTIGVIDGPPGTFKSFVALDLHLSTAARLEWLGQPIDRGPSLYIAAEGSAGLGARIRAWEAENGCEAPEDAYFLPEAVQLLQQQDNTDLLRAVARLSQMPVLIIIDTLSRSIAGFDENSSKDMSLLIEKADQLRRTTGAVVVFLHHTNKGAGTIRGSSAIPAGIDWQIELKRDGDLLTVTCEKQKDAEEFAPVHLVKKVYQLDEWRHHAGGANGRARPYLARGDIRRPGGNHDAVGRGVRGHCDAPRRVLPRTQDAGRGGAGRGRQPGPRRTISTRPSCQKCRTCTTEGIKWH